MSDSYELQNENGARVFGPYPKIGTLKGSIKTSCYNRLKPGYYDLVEYVLIPVKRTRYELKEDNNLELVTGENAFCIESPPPN